MTGRLPAALAALTVAALAGCSVSSASSASDRRTFVHTIAHDSQLTAAGTQDLLVEMGLLAKATDPASQATDVSQLGSSAQQMHDELSGFYDEILSASAIGDNTELDVGVAVGELRDAAAKVAAWTQNPTSAGAQAAMDALTPAIADWDSSVTAMWKATGSGTPPTISNGA